MSKLQILSCGHIWFHVGLPLEENNARIAKAALHKLPEKSSLNVRSACTVFPVCPGCPVCPDHHDDHEDDDDLLDHDDHLNHDDYRIWKEVGGCTKQVGGYLIPYNLQLACIRQGFS